MPPDNDMISIQLYAHEKRCIRDLALYTIGNAQTILDLKSRKQWIDFELFDLSQLIGELCYYFNRCTDDGIYIILDELIGTLENSERKHR